MICIFWAANWYVTVTKAHSFIMKSVRLITCLNVFSEIIFYLSKYVLIWIHFCSTNLKMWWGQILILCYLLSLLSCCAVFTFSQLTGGYQGEQNGSSVTSVCLCLFTTCPIPSQSSSSGLVAIHTRFLQCCWHGSTVVVLFPFILIDGLLPSRCRKRKKKQPYRPRHGLSIVNLIDVCSLDLGHCISCGGS